MWRDGAASLHYTVVLAQRGRVRIVINSDLVVEALKTVLSLDMVVLCRIHVQLVFFSFAQAVVVGTIGVVANPWLTSVYATERAPIQRCSLAC